MAEAERQPSAYEKVRAETMAKNAEFLAGLGFQDLNTKNDLGATNKQPAKRRAPQKQQQDPERQSKRVREVDLKEPAFRERLDGESLSEYNCRFTTTDSNQWSTNMEVDLPYDSADAESESGSSDGEDDDDYFDEEAERQQLEEEFERGDYDDEIDQDEHDASFSEEQEYSGAMSLRERQLQWIYRLPGRDIQETIDGTPGWLGWMVRSASQTLEGYIMWNKDALELYRNVLRSATQSWVPYDRFDEYEEGSTGEVNNWFQGQFYSIENIIHASIGYIHKITQHCFRITVTLADVNHGFGIPFLLLLY